jgi:hypothetical protein
LSHCISALKALIRCVSQPSWSTKPLSVGLALEHTGRHASFGSLPWIRTHLPCAPDENAKTYLHCERTACNVHTCIVHFACCRSVVNVNSACNVSLV